MTTQPIPQGYGTVTPYLVVEDAGAVIDFATRAFDATERMRYPDPATGRIMHAEISIGSSIVMIGEANDETEPNPATLHLYVEDTDAVYAQAMAAGGTSLREPRTEFYGDRMAGVRDSQGNSWWLATHVEDVTPEEMERRAAQQT
jgi:PhnB protein